MMSSPSALPLDGASCRTPAKRRPRPGVCCGCYFGADRCSDCDAARKRVAAARPQQRSPSPLSSSAAFASLPEDVLERVALACGKSLPAFASVNHAVRLVVRPAMWRQAYEEAWGAPLTCGEAMPPALWRACLIKDAMA